ncbi:carbohydrate porin [Variovorax ginsengisoli]|uniref:Maltoporin n=1 Tax=Variovorax ginsengisoli TaxID=363844 RepID=A0ABT9SC02_9BURK|nr:carbohydrate porin [Variovorax ginsengisoli]MDP9901881.1 maltoporin [Variovorax ginsengisoli]
MILTACASAIAAEEGELEFAAYLRTGASRASVEGAPRGGYSLGLAGQKLRLGNEGDFYGEVKLGRTLELGSGLKLRAVWGGALYDPAPTPDHLHYTLKQAFVELAGLPMLPDQAVIWVGQRAWHRESLHIVDTDYLLPDSGRGFGIHGLPAGPGLFGVAYFGKIIQNVAQGVQHDIQASRLSIDWSAVPIGERGDLRVQGSLVHGGGASGERDGQSLSLRHRCAVELTDRTLRHTTWLQFSSGQGALDNGFGAFSSTVGRTAQRFVHAVEGQSGPLGAQALMGIERGRTDGMNQVDNGWVTGGRLSWDIARHAKLLFEAGYNERRPDDGGALQRLSKFTIAPTLSAKPGFNGRPELRLFVTRVRMNDAAAAALAMPGRARSVTLVGLQLETWL